MINKPFSTYYKLSYTLPLLYAAAAGRKKKRERERAALFKLRRGRSQLTLCLHTAPRTYTLLYLRDLCFKHISNTIFFDTMKIQ